MTVSRKLILTVNVNYTKLQLRKKNFTCWPLNAHMIQLLTPGPDYRKVPKDAILLPKVMFVHWLTIVENVLVFNTDDSCLNVVWRSFTF